MRRNDQLTMWQITPADGEFIASGGMGAPTVGIEKLPRGDEPRWAIEAK